LRDRTAGNSRGKRADNCTGDETSSHCYTPFGFGFEQVLYELAVLRNELSACRVKGFMSRMNIAHGFWRRKEKPPSSALNQWTVAKIQRRDKISCFQGPSGRFSSLCAVQNGTLDASPR
jgi:hypothetical protein